MLTAVRTEISQLLLDAAGHEAEEASLREQITKLREVLQFCLRESRNIRAKAIEMAAEEALAHTAPGNTQ